MTQVALSLLLVVGATLFVRTFAALAHVRLGFDPAPILLVEANTKRSSVPAKERPALFERMRQAVAAVPGVQNAALESITPLSFSEWDTLIENPAGLSLPESERTVYMNAISPGWFDTYGTPLLAGRDFTTRDSASAPRVVIVNETFAKKYFGGANPVGRWVRNEPSPGENPPQLEIVGLARDAVYNSLREHIPPTMYEPVAQAEGLRVGITIAARGIAGPASSLAHSIGAAIERVDGAVTLTMHPLTENVRANTVQERVLAMLSGFFGGLALLLAGIGLYGVMSYAVTRRRTEIGIRMALGAGPAGAIGLILRRVVLLVATGVLVGASVAVWASRFVESLLFGLAPRDPAALTTAAGVLALVGAVAAWLPARRAARIDPARVLREG